MLPFILYFFLIQENAQLFMLIQWYNWAKIIAVIEKKINVEMNKIIFHFKVTFKMYFALSLISYICIPQQKMLRIPR